MVLGYDQVIISLICIISASTVVYGFYNVFLHPLSQVPGPWLWKAFRWPYLLAMLCGDLPQRIKEYHDRYGAVVRVAPDELSFLNGWKDIYSSKYLDRPWQWRFNPPGVKVDNLITARREEHARLRKAILPVFDHQAIKEQEKLVIHHVNLLIGKLHKLISDSPHGVSTILNMVEWISYASFDLTGDLLWGRPLQCLDMGCYQPWMVMLTQYRAALFAVAFNYWPPLNYLVSFLTPPFALKALREVWTIARDNVQYRLALDRDCADFVSPILAHGMSTPSGELSLDEIISNSMIFVLGGTETVTAAIMGTIQHLLANPDTMCKLRVEIRSAFAVDADITGVAAEALPYLDAVLHEGLRVCPPFPDSLRRVVPRDGYMIAGLFVPGGMTVSSACWASFQSPEMFHEPTSFVPERWLRSADGKVEDGKGGKETSSFASDRRDIFHPFSLGPRNCPGQRLAWLEMRILLAKLVWGFDFRVPRGRKLTVWKEHRIFWHWEQERLDIEMRRRDNGAKWP